MSYENVDKMCKIVHKLFGNISSFTYLYGIRVESISQFKQ